MSTPQPIIETMVLAGQHADATHPGLRERDADAWMQIAAGYACARNPSIGRKSTSASSRISPDTMACLAPGGFYAVSIIRDDPEHGNEWRSKPLDHGLVSGQMFHAVPPLQWDQEPLPDPSDIEQRVVRIEAWIRSFGGAK